MSASIKKRGRPPKPNSTRTTLRLADDVIEYYRRVGDGELTAGIERVARELMSRRTRNPH